MQEAPAIPGIFDALPGIDVPVGGISSGLAAMWKGESSSGRPAPEGDVSKAIQVNFVLHLGLLTVAEDAVRQFGVAVKFSRRYPCRVVVLCPMDGEGDGQMRAKVYGECTLGKSKDDKRCCEFVMLSYPRKARIYLESQVSICLSTDIPLYYWAHRFSAAARLADYTYLLTNAKRVIFDGATIPSDALGYPWPKPENVRDLAYARLLPVRQSIGQFLSRYPAPAIGVGLKSVVLRHGSALGAEARALSSWFRDRVTACGATQASHVVSPAPELGPRTLDLAFTYGDERSFSWKADLETSHSEFDARLGAARTTMTASVTLLEQENALSEAMFF